MKIIKVIPCEIILSNKTYWYMSMSNIDEIMTY